MDSWSSPITCVGTCLSPCPKQIYKEYSSPMSLLPGGKGCFFLGHHCFSTTHSDLLGTLLQLLVFMFLPALSLQHVKGHQDRSWYPCDSLHFKISILLAKSFQNLSVYATGRIIPNTDGHLDLENRIILSLSPRRQVQYEASLFHVVHAKKIFTVPFGAQVLSATLAIEAVTTCSPSWTDQTPIQLQRVF
jgi:hypothetical protein